MLCYYSYFVFCEADFLFLVSLSGHTLLIVCKGVGQYVELGGTLDDSVGETYDKMARLFGLEWEGGGGKPLERIARDGVPV
jgi:N6-L-threonylcarbamoyladenine synthase